MEGTPKTYTICKGKEDSVLMPRIWVSENQWRIVGHFEENCIYNLNDRENQEDYNKLFGVGFGFTPFWNAAKGKLEPAHHRNSMRWGWRWNIETHLFELAPYCYFDKILYMHQPMVTVEPNQTFDLTIVNQGKYATFWSEDRDVLTVMKPITSDFGTRLDFVFGGTVKKAPHDMTIKINEIFK